MRVVVQRVSRAEVFIAGRRQASIRRGLVLLAAVERGDGEAETAWMAEKILSLRIFPDDQERMNLAIREINGEILSISQFTLASRIARGRRPDFTRAEEPAKAKLLYERFNEQLAAGVTVRTGVFGAMMEVQLVNDGPVTFVIERNPVPPDGGPAE
jgi:D-aminoacyl-tRNA deacylase